MKIREYAEKDFEDLVCCMEKLQDYIVSIDDLWINIRSLDYGVNYSWRLLRRVEENEGVIYMAYDQDELVWCMAAIIEHSDQNDAYETIPVKLWRIVELFVDEKYRWNGIWKKLIKIAEDYFVEKDCDISRIEVFAPNKLANDFYYEQDYRDRMVDLCKVLKP